MKRLSTIAILCLAAFTLTAVGSVFAAGPANLKRAIPKKPNLKSIPANADSGTIVFKIAEGLGQPALVNGKFDRTGPQWDRLNNIIAPATKANRSVQPHFSVEKSTLNQMRDAASARTGFELPDLTLYNELKLPANAPAAERLDAINSLNSLDIIEIAYFQPAPSPAAFSNLPTLSFGAVQATPDWQANQYYLNPAPTGVDAYYAWNIPGGKGENVKVIDIEGNWNESHEDLRGGSSNFHIAGARINDPSWFNHGTAVLGEIAADSNGFGMTGISFNVDLGTVSIGSMSTADAITTAAANSDTGDVILIELHAPGPHYNFEERSDQAGYVAMEYWQANFDAILTASANGRIIVEAAGNGNENFDDQSIYGRLFDPAFRFSGAIMVGASNAGHVPASFSNYGQRLDAHGFGAWDVYTLGYGGLYGWTDNNNYTGTFSGTSSASPIVVGAVASMQGVHKATHARYLDHNGIRSLITTHGTPQASHYKTIGPLPDLQGSLDEVVGVSFTADTTLGWVPFDVAFSGSSGLPVDSWTWDFGDGDSSSLQSPTHTYNTPGIHNVTLQIDADGETRSAQRFDYIIALADTIDALDAAGNIGQEFQLVIRARNIVPLRSITIPIQYPGDLPLDYVSYNTTGCRTDYFEDNLLQHIDRVGRRLTIKLTAANDGSQPALPPGEGDILKIVFRVESGAIYGQTAQALIGDYLTNDLQFNGSSMNYAPIGLTGTISVCIARGDMDGASGTTVSDITYLTDFLFRGGFPPSPIEAGDVNCSDDVNVADLTYMVNYLFQGGSAPCGC